MKRYDLICLGHISLDLFFGISGVEKTDDRFELARGGKYVADSFRFSLGGGGFNVAAGVQKLGYRSAVMATFGNNPFRKLIMERLKKLKLTKSLLLYEPSYINISSILVGESGERSIINFETKHQNFFTTERAYRRLLQTHYIYLGNLPEISFTQRKKILSYARANKITTIVNLGVNDCRRPTDELVRFFKDVDLVIANGHEIADMAKIPYKKINFSKSIFSLMSYLSSKIVIVTDSGRGSFGYEGKNVYYQKAYEPKKIIDTTGAGDAYTAGFIVNYIKKEDVKSAMKTGSIYARQILAKIGAN